MPGAMRGRGFSAVTAAAIDGIRHDATDPAEWQTYRARARQRGLVLTPGLVTAPSVTAAIAASVSHTVGRYGNAVGAAFVLVAPAPDKVRQVEEMADPIKVAEAMTVRRRGRWAESGDDLSMDRLWNGQVETAWRTTRPRLVQGARTVRVLVNTGALDTVTPKEMAWRAATGVAIVRAAEIAGYAVELWQGTLAVGMEGAPGGLCATRVLAKSSDTPLAIAPLVAALCREEWHRGVTWDMRQLGQDEDPGRHRVGSSTRFADRLHLLGLAETETEKTLVVDYNCRSREVAETTIREAVARLDALATEGPA